MQGHFLLHVQLYKLYVLARMVHSHTHGPKGVHHCLRQYIMPQCIHISGLICTYQSVCRRLSIYSVCFHTHVCMIPRPRVLLSWLIEPVTGAILVSVAFGDWDHILMCMHDCR